MLFCAGCLANPLQDDRGVDGVIIVPDTKRRKVIVGSKLSVDKVRQDEHESASLQDLAFQRDADKLTLDVNTQAQATNLFLSELMLETYVEHFSLRSLAAAGAISQ